MNIIDWASLKTAVGDWLNRADLTSRIPDFIGLAEVRMMDELPPTRLLETEITLNPAVGVRTLSLPADFRSPLNLWWNNGVDREPVRYVPPDLLDVWQSAGRPLNFTIDGTDLAFERPTDQAYTFAFRYVITLGLSDEVTTNTLLTQYPNLYLFGALAEAAPFLRDASALQTWEAKYQQALENAKRRQSQIDRLTTLSTEVAYNGRRHGSFSILRGY